MARILTTGPAILNKIVKSTGSHISGAGGSHGGGGASRASESRAYTPSTTPTRSSTDEARIARNYVSADDFSTPTSNGSVSNPSGGGSSGSGGSSGGSTGSNRTSGGSTVNYSADVSGQPNDYYNQALDAYQASLDAQRAAMEAEYNNARNQLGDAYNRSRNNLSQNADDAYRQAYITYMQNRRGLNQQLANAGINGGAMESTIANLYNNYGNDRAGIEREYAGALGDLEADYNSNLANLSANYGSDYSGILSDYYNNLANFKAGYAQDLANILQKSGNNRQLNPVAPENGENGIAPDLQSISNLGRNLNAEDEATANNVSQTGRNLLSTTPGSGAMVRNFQSYMQRGDEAGAFAMLDQLLAQGYPRALINEIIEASGY